MAAEGWEHFTHAADMGVRGWGPTTEKAFEQAAIAVTATIADPDSIRCTHRVQVHCEAPDPELLLADWLNALIYEMATRHMLFGRFKVQIRDGRLEGTAWGEAIDRARHQPAVEVKGATYTELAVRDDPDRGRIAQCVIDV